ncbi:hypothetical protein ABQF34_28045 [Mycolicibacterium boenickei]
MSGKVRVKGPDGNSWTVRRRWFPWRPALLLTKLWLSIPDDDKTPETIGAMRHESKSSDVSTEFAISVVLQPITALIELGRFMLLILVLVISLMDLAIQLLVMPAVLLARTLGVIGWPVQIDLEKRHFHTARASGFGAAAVLRDELASIIRQGAFTPYKSQPK